MTIAQSDAFSVHFCSKTRDGHDGHDWAAKKKEEQHQFSVLFVTHDLSVARKISDRAMVTNQGEIVGIGAPHDVLDNPADPYIAQLVRSVFTFGGSY